MVAQPEESDAMRWKYWLAIKGQRVKITMSDDMTIDGVATECRLSDLVFCGRAAKCVLEINIDTRGWIDLRTVKAIDLVGEAV